MIQLKFDFKKISKKRIERPSEISEELVFAVIDDIKKQSKNKKLTNKKIIDLRPVSW
ncbi:hypothetical protein [Francisella sp. XLW-1]|uniref:hypothetical protein n=1 Tax=Francisella sp. XLW-1 TaxID=2610887 RepID=UPI00168D2903|nr:hypothetical protein [Francisella sp. XLW-1]